MRLFAALLLLVPGTASAASIGLWDGWAAFSDTTQKRCHVVVRPLDEDGNRKRAGALRIGWFADGKGGAGEVSVMPSRALAPGRALRLEVAGRRFELTVRGDAAYARDPRMDRAILTALRGARALSVEGVRADGGRLVDAYPLKGAASAIDAAALACAGMS